MLPVLDVNRVTCGRKESMRTGDGEQLQIYAIPSSLILFAFCGTYCHLLSYRKFRNFRDVTIFLPMQENPATTHVTMHDKNDYVRLIFVVLRKWENIPQGKFPHLYMYCMSIRPWC